VLILYCHIFICPGCWNSVTSTGCTSVDVGASANLKLVDKFCYLHDMLRVNADADGIGWNKFRQFVAVVQYLNRMSVVWSRKARKQVLREIATERCPRQNLDMSELK